MVLIYHVVHVKKPRKTIICKERYFNRILIKLKLYQVQNKKLWSSQKWMNFTAKIFYVLRRFICRR
jgi:hypothetical protein